MSGKQATPARRTRVERNIYVRRDGKTYEVGYRDSDREAAVARPGLPADVQDDH